MLGILLAARLLVRNAEREKLDPTPLADFAMWGVLVGVVVGEERPHAGGPAHAVHLQHAGKPSADAGDHIMN